MGNFIHWIHLFVCVSLVHRVALLHIALLMALPSQSLRWWVHPYLPLDLVPLCLSMTALSMKKRHHDANKPS
jgi:hypothetical protein